MARRAEGWTLHRDDRTGIYTVRFRWAGRRYHRSTGRRDRGEAQTVAAAIVQAVRTGRTQQRTTGAGALVGVDVADLVGGWLASAERQRRPSTVELWQTYAAAHWIPFFTDGADLVDSVMLHRYVAHRLEHVLAGTVAKECSALQSLVDWMARPDVAILAEPIKVPRPAATAKGTRQQKRHRVDLTAAQAETLIAALPERLRDGQPCRTFFRVMWETGLRRGTLLGLEAPGDYRKGGSELRIRAEIDKADYDRTLPLTMEARAALDAVCPARGPIFRVGDHRYHLRRAAKAAGVPEHLARYVSHHDFRHGRTTDLLDRGAPLTGVAYLVGHRQVTTTNRYAHASERAARQALGLDSGHRPGHRPPEAPPETTKPAEVAGSDSSTVSVVCGREDSNLHSLSATRSLGQRLRLQGAGSQGFSASGGDPSPLESLLSGHGVPLREAAIAYCEAVEAGDPARDRLGLDLAERVAAMLELAQSETRQRAAGEEE